MECQSFNRVFNNEYLMLHILRMLSLKEQFICQKCCHYLHYLVVKCVWKQDWKAVDRIQAFDLAEEEFCKFLHLNAANVEKLTVYIRHADDLQKYFSKSYENLSELRIMDITTYELEFNSILLGALHELKNLKVLSLQNVTIAFSCKDISMLIENVPLKCLKLHDCVQSQYVDLKKAENCDDLNGLDVRITFFEIRPRNLLWFIDKCPNLKQLETPPEEIFNDGYINKFNSLEKLLLRGTFLDRPLKMSSILGHTGLKELIILRVENIKKNFDILKNDQMCFQLETLKVVTAKSRLFWTSLFQSPAISFKNLQHLYLAETMDEDTMRCISVKCGDLKSLVLYTSTNGKYINHLQHLQTLKLYATELTWSELYNILHDLKLLEHFDLCGGVRKDELPEGTTMRNLGNSLISLNLSLSKTFETLFWEHVSMYSVNCFPKLTTMTFYSFQLSKHYCEPFFATFPQLTRLELPDTEHYSLYGYNMPTVKHLVIDATSNIKWNNIVNILKGSNIQLLDLNIYSHSTIPEYALNTFKHLHYISLHYDLIEKTQLFWRQHMKECENFRLACTSNNTDEVIKFLLLLLEDTQTPRIKSIHIHFDMELLSLFKEHCKEEFDRCKIPVLLLDKANDVFRAHICDYAVIVVL